MATLSFLRVLLVIVVAKNLKPTTISINIAFLNDELFEEIYMNSSRITKQ